MRIIDLKSSVRIEDEDFFDISQTFDCGQTFRFDRVSENTVFGIAHKRALTLSQEDGAITLDCTLDEFESIWRRYLALDIDYKKINSFFTSGDDEVLKSAATYGRGIRILRQDPWEALCSFIISQNNNIPRIKKIINALSERYGDPIEKDGRVFYSFPSADALALAGTDAIFELRTGFRAKYISDAAEKVASGEIDLDSIASLPTAEALSELMKIKGVGPKVASCALLFGFDKPDAFPIDVWVKKVFAKYYPNGFDITSFGNNAGIAQQYLFYYERWNSKP